MKLRVCSNVHFVRAIKDGTVQIVQNVDSHGRPGLTFKKLEDLLGVENDASPCWPHIDRSTNQSSTGTTELCCDGLTDEKNCESDELFGEMTLKDLKKKCRTKKRKTAEPVLLIPKREPSDLEPSDDDLDFEQPLSCLKSKLPKSPKSKKKRAKKTVFASNGSALSLNTEQTKDAEVAPQSNGDLFPIIAVKDECQEAKNSDCQNMNYLTESNISDQLVGFPGMKSSENFEMDSGKDSISDADEVSLDNLEHCEPIIYLPWNDWKPKEVGNVEMAGHLSPVARENDLTRDGEVNTLPSGLSSTETLSPNKKQSLSSCSSFQTCPDMQQSVPSVDSNIGIEVSDSTADDGLCYMEIGHLGNSCMDDNDDMKVLPPNQENESMSSPVKKICSTLMSNCCPSPVNGTIPLEDHSPCTVEKPPATSTKADTELDFLDSNNHTTFLEDASPNHEDKQTVSMSTYAERKISDHIYPQCDTVSECSSPEIKEYQYGERQQPPERFPSTRKVISPTSQEKLCLAMKNCESQDDINLYKCKEKLFFVKQDVEKASVAGSDTSNGTSFSPKEPEKVIRTKFTISPTQILKKLKNDKRPPLRKGSAPKGCLEGPRLCRSLPRLSTGCTIQACSESAIAFSQRQMHDIESLALKLMTELKSMKDIVEEKVLYESYRSTSLKNDADEVKLAIKTATKTEETAKKWLSMMSRDCTRFCKIMKLTDNDSPTVNTIQDNTPQKEGRKISFADEAGGMLCDVKLFDDGLAFKDYEIEQKPQV